ncbi:MAG TPA: glycosyltransferase [Crinalium sp.]|jgi:glycosyltransferase involved in cell wall biosynthesis
MPLISIITPVYNGEKTIRETIASVLNQTFQDFELIIVDDSSQDATLDILASITDPRLKVFSYAKTNQSNNRNLGIAQATGDYLAFIDADDLWTADKLERQLAALQDNSQAAIAYSWTDYIDESGQFLRSGSHITANGNVYAQLLLTNFIENGSNPLIKRSAVLEVGGFDPSLLTAEDWDLWLRLAARYEFVAVPMPQILYRVSSHSASNRIAQMEAGSLTVIHRAFQNAPAALQPLKPLSLGNLYKYLLCKTLEGIPDRKEGLQAIRILYCILQNDPNLIKTKVFFKILIKVLIVLILSQRFSHVLLQKLDKVLDVKTLYGYLQLASV